MTFVIANGDIDLSVGSVLALSASTAAFLMSEYAADPVYAVASALVAGTLAGIVNGVLTVRFRLPAFVATLGMFYIARGIGAWLVRRPAAFRFSRDLQFARPQGDRDPALLGHGAVAWTGL